MNNFVRMNSSFRYSAVVLLLAGGILGCKKDHVPLPVQPTKWEQIEGTYKVYDTTGVYLYKMKIEHFRTYNQYGNPTDSLQFNNFDGQFILYKRQSQATNVPLSFISIGFHEQLMDTNSNRWKINQSSDMTYNNWYNDTINLRFTRHNLNYYIQDMTPYQDLDRKQIAVKQH